MTTLTASHTPTRAGLALAALRVAGAWAGADISAEACPRSVAALSYRDGGDAYFRGEVARLMRLVMTPRALE